jgi:hypothetical protein
LQAQGSGDFKDEGKCFLEHHDGGAELNYYCAQSSRRAAMLQRGEPQISQKGAERSRGLMLAGLTRRPRCARLCEELR